MIKIKGLNGFKSGINRINTKLISQNRVSLIKSMLIVEAEAARRTPVDTGNLRSSGLGNATVYKSDSSGASGVVYNTANYAVPVHEITTNRHKVGEAKFLKNAMEAKLPEIKALLDRDYKNFLR